jgi:hypothetical protein
MSQIQTLWVEQFNSNLDITPQQLTSKLLGTVTTKFNVNAETAWYDTTGVAEGEDDPARYADAPNNVKSRERRGLVPRKSHTGEVYDTLDQLRMLADPTNEDMVAMRAYCARKIDFRISRAAVGLALTRDSQGETSNVAFDTATKRVAVNVMNKGESPANTGLNVGKIAKGLELLSGAEIEPSTDEIWCVIGNQQANDLIQEVKVGSSDYNSLMPMMTGQIGRYMGVNFIRYGNLQVPVTNQRQCLMYTTRAIVAGFLGSQPIEGKMWKRSDLADEPWYGYAKTEVGAVRRHDVGVVDILCLEV